MRARSLCLAIALGALAGCATTGGRTALPALDDDAGVASFYGRRFQGRTTASGEPYDADQLTAAHRTLPFGTRVKVTNLDNRRSVVVRVNDRGPFKSGRIIDVSKKAADQLDFVAAGLARVKIEVVGD
jgi:rare lipoprotein A